MNDEMQELKDRMTVIESKLVAVCAANVSMAQTIQDHKIATRERPEQEAPLNQDKPHLSPEQPKEVNMSSEGKYIKRMGHRWFILDKHGDKVAGPWRRKTPLMEEAGIKRTVKLSDGSYEIVR